MMFIMKKLALLTLSLILIIFIAGCSQEPTTQSIIQEQTTTQTTSITKGQALLQCYKKAKECSEGVPYIEDEFKKVCFQLYYYTGDAAEILDFIKDMC